MGTKKVYLYYLFLLISNISFASSQNLKRNYSQASQGELSHFLSDSLGGFGHENKTNHDSFYERSQGTQTSPIEITSKDKIITVGGRNKGTQTGPIECISQDQLITVGGKNKKKPTIRFITVISSNKKRKEKPFETIQTVVPRSKERSLSDDWYDFPLP